jgi:hypothetical protein
MLTREVWETLLNEKIYLFIYRILKEKELIFIYFFKLKDNY